MTLIISKLQKSDNTHSLKVLKLYLITPKIQGIPLMKGDIRFSNSVK